MEIPTSAPEWAKEWTGKEPRLAHRYVTDEFDEFGTSETADVCEYCFDDGDVPESWDGEMEQWWLSDVTPWDRYRCHLCDYSPIVFAEDWYEEGN